MRLVFQNESRAKKRLSAALLVSGAILAMCLLGIVNGAADDSKLRNPSLKETFKDDFLVGVAINRAQIFEQDSLGVSIIQSQFNSISPENILKWQFVHPEPDKYDFSGADRYVRFGEKHHMAIIGHTLVWHNQTPDWVFQDANGKPVDRGTLLERMSNHIRTVVGRYKGRIKGWDVVNEAIADDGSLRQTPWLKIIGKDYIEKAYQFAHEADPQAELYYNDFALENEAKRNAAIALIKDLQKKGIHISAVGLQGHYRLDNPGLKDVEEAILAMSTLGLKVMITEMDVNVLPQPKQASVAEVSQRFAARPELNPYANGLPDTVQQELARRYAGLFSIFLKHRGQISRVTFWGVADGDSWLNDWPVPGRTAYPLLFDRHHAPKPAFHAVIQAATELNAGVAAGKRIVQKASDRPDAVHEQSSN